MSCFVPLHHIMRENHTILYHVLYVQAGLLETAFSSHTDLLTIAAHNGLPAAKDLQAVLKPLSQQIAAVQV